MKNRTNYDIYGCLKDRVLNWLETMRIGPCQYRMNAGSDSSIFTSCFALFIVDLFGELGSLSEKERKRWANYIKGFQDKQSGLFIPDNILRYDKERLTQQLTCFCLSALEILGDKPTYPLIFMDSYKTAEDIKNYLYNNACHKGLSGTGNKAMFLGIFLTYLIKYENDNSARIKLDAWFDWHDKLQNPKTGLWGPIGKSSFYHGLQNGFHQLLIYFYWRRPIRYLNKIMDAALSIQDKEGFFAPIPGWAGCWEYDAVHILSNAFKILKAKENSIFKSLKKAHKAILSNQNSDGGFCQSKKKPKNVMGFFKNIPFFFYGNEPYLWYYRIRQFLNVTIRKKEIIYTGWTKKGRNWGESNLWDTWICCLSFAEISYTIKEKNSRLADMNFQNMIGLGYFKK